MTFLSKALNKGKDDEMGTPMDSLQIPDLSCITNHSFGDFPTLTEGYNFLLLLKWWANYGFHTTKYLNVIEWNNSWIKATTMVTSAFWATDDLHKYQQLLNVFSNLPTIYHIIQTLPFLTINTSAVERI